MPITLDQVSFLGPWVVVTGASSGIGKEFSLQLAALGLNIVLVSRRESVLLEVASVIESAYGVKTKIIVADLSSPEGLRVIEEQTQDMDIGGLISNAGDAAMGAFLTVARDKLRSVGHVNVNAHMELAHYFGSRIIQQREGRGGILLVSSTTAMQGVPYAGDYAAAKAYVLALGEAMNAEAKHLGLRVSVLVPGPTDTPGIGVRDDIDFSKLPMKPMRVETVVGMGIRALVKNKAVCIPGMMNKMMAGLMGRRIFSRAANVSMWGMLMARCIPKAGKLIAVDVKRRA